MLYFKYQKKHSILLSFETFIRNIQKVWFSSKVKLLGHFLCIYIAEHSQKASEVLRKILIFSLQIFSKCEYFVKMGELFLWILSVSLYSSLKWKFPYSKSIFFSVTKKLEPSISSDMNTGTVAGLLFSISFLVVMVMFNFKYLFLIAHCYCTASSL